ncbi:flagellar assembly protein FliH [Pseudalkalibacillus salsuginis]|uniref:flagellar assembly protein FliH n=1 Tax=Pseudalkalibacillus salsuginis TaxID=2910972 RepID=UPI001F26F44B|nr:flagellar assembly protein FliH [Pseudalkalibacillus salsuginis]MCF6410566.1 flagellar assembly protein FliH [Pseudalkalibacillus salsuginis]
MSKVIKFSPLLNQIDHQPVEIKRLNSFQLPEPVYVDNSQSETKQFAAQQKAQKILAEAERQAAELLERAEKEVAAKDKELRSKEAAIDMQIEEARNIAASEGYEEGYQKGMAQAELDYKNALDQAKEILSMAQASYEHKVKEAEPEIIQLSVEIAGKIVAEKLEYEEKWTHYISETLKQVKGEADIKLFVSPKYYELTSTYAQELSVHLNSEILVYPEVSMKDHLCLIETKYGQIDASVDSQMSEIKKKLLELVGEEHGHQVDAGCRK